MVGAFGFAPKKTMRARAFRLARELVKQGHAVKLVMPPFHTPEEGGREWVEDGVEICYVPIKNAVQIVREMVREVNNFQPDVVHIFKTKGYAGAVAEWLWRTRRNKIRIVVDMDDWEGWGGWNELEDYPRPMKHVFAAQEQWGIRHTHALTVASKALQTLAWGHGAENVFYVPNGTGIDFENIHRRERKERKEKTLLVYSRFFEFDVGRLVEVIARTVMEVPDLRVLVVGASLMAGDGERFQRLMMERGLWERVEDVGWVEESELPNVLQRGTVGIYLMDDNLLNRTKCPVKLADMAALGIPVVGEAVGQVTEYVKHGETGFLIDSGCVQSGTIYLTQLLKNDDLCVRMGYAARQHMQAFQWLKLATTLEAAYSQVRVPL